MFSPYFAVMLLLLAAGTICMVSATSTLIFGAGLIPLTTGAGGLSAGLMTRGAK